MAFAGIRILSCLLAFVQHLLHSVAFCSSTVVVAALGPLEHLAPICNVGVINTQTSKSDMHLISPNKIISESCFAFRFPVFYFKFEGLDLWRAMNRLVSISSIEFN